MDFALALQLVEMMTTLMLSMMEFWLLDPLAACLHQSSTDIRLLTDTVLPPALV